MKAGLLGFSILLFSNFIWSQNVSNREPFRVAFYNLENLFDTIKDRGKEDFEFLPSSQKQWNTEKYNAKIHHLARAIANIGDWEGPDVLGVCEVEHQSCLEDLVNTTALKQLNYGIIHQESDDNRGIDVGCIYKKNKFELIDYQYIIRIHINNQRNYYKCLFHFLFPQIQLFFLMNSNRIQKKCFHQKQNYKYHLLSYSGLHHQNQVLLFRMMRQIFPTSPYKFPLWK